MPTFYERIQNFFTPDLKFESKAGTDHLGRPTEATIETKAAVVQHYATSVPVIRYDAKREELNSVFYTIVNRIQTTATSIPWNVYYLSANDENAKKAVNHPLSKLLYRPNDKQSWSEFIACAIGEYLYTGNLWIYVLRVDNEGLNHGQPKEFHIMPRTTKVDAGSGWLQGIKSYYFVDERGNKVEFNSADVLHLKNYNPYGGDYGLAPHIAGALSLSSLNYALKQQIQQLAIGGPATSVFKDVDTEEEENEFSEAEEIALDYKIKTSKGFSFVNQKLGKVQIGLSSAELQLLESINADSGRIADLLGYPADLLSSSTHKIYNVVSEAQKTLYNDRVIPLLENLRDGLNHLVGPYFKDGVYIDIDPSVIEVLKPNLTDTLRAAAASPFMSVNEQRRMSNLPAIEGGDGFLVSAGYVYKKSISDSDILGVDTYGDEDDEIGNE